MLSAPKMNLYLRMTALAHHQRSPKAWRSLFTQEDAHLKILHRRAILAPRSRGSSLLFPSRVQTRSACRKFKKTSSCATKPSSTLPRRSPCPSRRTRSVASRIHSPVVSALQPWPRGGHTYPGSISFGWASSGALPRHHIVPPEGEGVGELNVQGRHHPLKKAIGVAVNSADFRVDVHKGIL